MRLRVHLRVKFVCIPGIPGERIFRDALQIVDPEECSYQSVSHIVEQKLTFMEVPPMDFTIFHEEAGGDRVVVDDAYMVELVRGWCKEAQEVKRGKLCRQNGQVLGAEDDVRASSTDSDEEITLSQSPITMEVECRKMRSADGLCDALLSGTSGDQRPAVVVQPLTLANLAMAQRHEELPPLLREHTAVIPPMSSSSAERHMTVDELTYPLTTNNYFLRCIVHQLRYRQPKPDVSLVEIDLGDAERPSSHITAVSFDACVIRSAKESLRADHRQVVEIRHAHVKRKTEVEARYQTNAHPLQLRLDRNSKIEIVQLLSVPAALPSRPDAGGIITTRPQLRTNGVVDVVDLMPRQPSAMAGSVVGGFTSSSSSSVMSGAPRRTVFSFNSANSGSTHTAVPVNGVVPSQHGQHVMLAQTEYLARRRAEEPLPVEPGMVPVSRKDVRQREPLVQQHVNKESERKDRIRRRVEVSTRCMLCGLDLEDEDSCMAVIRRQLEASSRNRGTYIPNVEEVRSALCDRRKKSMKGAPRRLTCTTPFVNTATKSVHLVHCRCAHLCADYQNGKDLEDVAVFELPMHICSLCGMPGAFVSCYHPDCVEMYHPVCAIFSFGYVNFGKKDPFLPCPACPHHTQVVVSKSSREPAVMHADANCWEDDDIAFDSRVVETTDLRDPDENGGA